MLNAQHNNASLSGPSWALRSSFSAGKTHTLKERRAHESRFSSNSDCIYTSSIHFSWNERKRISNLRDHKLDFIDAQRVFHGPTATYEDDRLACGEQRFITLGLLDGIAVSIAHTEAIDHIHVISFRRATRHEEAFLFKSIEN